MTGLFWCELCSKAERAQMRARAVQACWYLQFVKNYQLHSWHEPWPLFGTCFNFARKHNSVLLQNTKLSVFTQSNVHRSQVILTLHLARQRLKYY